MVGVDDGAPVARGKAWRWGLYAISLGLAFPELVTGLVAQKKDEWVLPWVLSYVSWTLVFFIFTLSCHQASPQRFVVSSFGYLICTAATLALFRMLGATSEENIYIWIPIATNCGIFVGLGARDSLKCFWRPSFQVALLDNRTKLEDNAFRSSGYSTDDTFSIRSGRDIAAESIP